MDGRMRSRPAAATEARFVNRDAFFQGEIQIVVPGFWCCCGDFLRSDSAPPLGTRKCTWAGDWNQGSRRAVQLGDVVIRPRVRLPT